MLKIFICFLNLSSTTLALPGTPGMRWTPGEAPTAAHPHHKTAPGSVAGTEPPGLGARDAQKLGWAAAAGEEERGAEQRLMTFPLAEQVKAKKCRSTIWWGLFPAVAAELLCATTSEARLHLVQHLGLCSRFGWSSTKEKSQESVMES